MTADGPEPLVYQVRCTDRLLPTVCLDTTDSRQISVRWKVHLLQVLAEHIKVGWHVPQLNGSGKQALRPPAALPDAGACSQLAQVYGLGTLPDACHLWGIAERTPLAPAIAGLAHVMGAVSAARCACTQDVVSVLDAVRKRAER